MDLPPLSIVAKRGGGKEAPSLFIKVSEDSIKDTDAYIRWVTEQLKSYPLNNEAFVFEIQEMVLQNHVRKAKVPVTIFLINGVKLQGVITWFDNFCVLLRRDGQSQLVYKHAISTIMPGAPISLYEGED